MTHTPALKSLSLLAATESNLYKIHTNQAAALSQKLANIRQYLSFQMKTAMKTLQLSLNTFTYVQKTQNGILLKQEEILKAFSFLTTVLLLVYVVIFKALFFTQSEGYSGFIISSPLFLSIGQLIAAFRKKDVQVLFISTCLMPALMIAVSFYNAEINYSKIILIYTLALVVLSQSKQIQLAGFVYLTMAYIMIQIRYYHTQATGPNNQLFAFDVVMMPVLNLVIFMVLSRIKREFTVYQKEIRQQKDILEKKNMALENLVSFSEQQRSKLKRTVLLKEKLISIISHDVRLPLSSFKLLINSYEKGYITDKMVIDGLLETKKDLSKIDGMVKDLVNWSRNDTATSQQPMNAENFSGMLESVLSIYTLCAKNKKLSLVPSVNIADNMCLAVPKRELEIIVRNLLSNALKYSNPDSKILISLDAKAGISGAVATLSVKDFGTGMHASILNQINGNRMTSSIGTFDEIGLGVGLSIVFDVINSHNLQYDIQSEPGKGTKFSVNIPLVSC